MSLNLAVIVGKKSNDKSTRYYFPYTHLRVSGGNRGAGEVSSRQAGRPREIFEISGKVVKELEKVEVEFSVRLGCL